MKGRWRQLLRSKTMYYPQRSRNVAGVYAAAKGYTVTEVMVFMAVTAAIFIMIAGSFSGRQRSTEFNTAAREMDSRLQDIANDVATGHYNNPGNFSCTVGVDGWPNIASGSNEQGTNEDCIFIGRVIQFIPGSRNMNVYTVVGARQHNGSDVTNLADARPTSHAVLTESHQIPAGLIMRDTGSTNDAIGFFTTFGAGVASDSGPTALSVDLIPMDGANVLAEVQDTSNLNLNKNPSDGYTVCLEGDGVNQHVLLTIGANRGRLATDMEFGVGSC